MTQHIRPSGKPFPSTRAARDSGTRLANVAAKLSATLAMLAVSVVSAGASTAGTAYSQPQTNPATNSEPQAKTKPPARPNTRVKLPPTAQQREAWRKSMVRSPRPKEGCFAATYPETTWKEVPCGTAPNRPYGPRNGIRPLTVGNGSDFAGQVTGNTSQSQGSFDTVTGVTSEADGGTANVFSLQLNTNRFTTNACTTFHATDPGCQGWEQFIFSNSGSAFIQYWILPFAAAGTACPAGWNAFNWPTPAQVSCFINSAHAAPVPHQTIAALGQMVLDGATGDSVTLTIGTNIFSATGDNHFPDLTNGWRFSEFNVFGDFNSSQAAFNNGSTIVVRTAVNSGMPAVPPTCSQQGFTGETNNLSLTSAPAVIPDVNWPSIVFTETNNNPTPVSCDNADSIGDTHLKTFAGLLYDFQASGDFVLAQDGPDFVVHARQASGAPTWPNAAINKAVAVQMGQTRVALYIEPIRLVIDGRSNDLADGKDLLLPTGVQVSRRGNLYAITSENGDSVRAVLNSTWIDVHVGLGHPQTHTRGLLANPSGNAQGLMTANGTVLKEPLSFTNLYDSYADGWRVRPNESLFTVESTIKAGIPDKIFYARQLNAQEYARAHRICAAVGVRSQALLDACTLDNAVLNDMAAAEVFVHAPRPRDVIKPVVVKPVISADR